MLHGRNILRGVDPAACMLFMVVQPTSRMICGVLVMIFQACCEECCVTLPIARTWMKPPHCDLCVVSATRCSVAFLRPSLAPPLHHLRVLMLSKHKPGAQATD
jgi:hypothetical protein